MEELAARVKYHLQGEGAGDSNLRLYELDQADCDRFVEKSLARDRGGSCGRR
jgi:hypothetical protein